MTDHEFLAELAQELAFLPLSERTEILSDIQDLIDDGVAVADFGSPAQFAQQFKPSSLGSAEQSTVPWYLPSFELLTDPDAKGRWWEPENPHIFIHKTLGIGWDINFAALAVKLGLLRPDDLDDEILESVPKPFTQTLNVAPLVIAAASTPALARLIRRGQSTTALGHALGISTISFYSRGNTPSNLITKCLATGFNAAIGLSAYEASAPVKNRTQKWLIGQSRALALLSAPALALVTIKLGLRNVTKGKS
ncbi:MAG: hypothetical protein GX483_06810 [Actinomycetaceae bacterium]|nr:hypothetical protein [Actinomycetaceae bacterium]